MESTADNPPVARRRRGRRPASEGNHAARVSILELKFPKSMRARCSWCNGIARAVDGRWLEVMFSSPGAGVTTGRVFCCMACSESVAYAGGSGLVTVPRPRDENEAAPEEVPTLPAPDHRGKGEGEAGFGIAG